MAAGTGGTNTTRPRPLAYRAPPGQRPFGAFPAAAPPGQAPFGAFPTAASRL